MLESGPWPSGPRFQASDPPSVSSALLGQKAELRHEGQHVEVMAYRLDLPPFEIRHPGGSSRLTLPGCRNLTGGTFERPRVRTFTSHFH